MEEEIERRQEDKIIQQPAQQIIKVFFPSDASEAVRTAKETALTIGFDQKASEEIAIAVSELATNLVKHAKGGTLTLTALTNGRKGIQIVSHDREPGIADVEKAIVDGFSTTGSLGSGLGTVNRLMHEFDITSRVGVGTHIVCKRWVREVAWSVMPCPLDFGAATRTYPGRDVNGDAFVIKYWGESVMVGVIDGLGHGQFAQQAAEAARLYVENHFEQPLLSIFRGAGRACYATRGVVMALARFDFGFKISDFRLKNQIPQSTIENRKLPIRLTFASIGNIEVRVFGSPGPMNFIVRRGIIGANAPDPVVTQHRWEPNYVMALHSDGLETHWHWEDFPELAEAPATLVARRLLQRLARDNDDATVVVVRDRKTVSSK